MQTEQAKQLYDRWLLDVPKLLDIAALYGPDNPELTRQLLTKVVFLQITLLYFQKQPLTFACASVMYLYVLLTCVF